MNEAREDDLVRLPEGHVLRECDYYTQKPRLALLPVRNYQLFVGMSTSSACIGYCYRKDYPKEPAEQAPASIGKIIQITACGHENTSSTQSNLTLFALCDNGRLWALDGASWNWVEVPLPVPDPKQ